MGINRIRLQDGATGDPRIDARMQQTYQENIAANEAQRQANEIALAEAKSRLMAPPRTEEQSLTMGPMPTAEESMDMTGPMFTGFDYSAQQPFSWSPGQAAPEGYRVESIAGDQFLERMYPSKEEIAGLPMVPMGLMGPMGPMLPGMMPPLEEDPYEGLSGQEYAEKYGIPYASGGRVGFQAGSPAEMAKAQAAAAQDPALDRIRQQLFGEGYVQDIGKGEGIAQYYSGFGTSPSLQFTQPGEEVTPVADVTQPVVDTGSGGGDGGDGGATGITSASAVQPTSDPFLASGAAGGARLPKITDQAGAIAAMTQPEAYSLPGQSDPFLASGAAGGARLPATQATTTLPSGDIFATDDPTLPEKMDYTEQQDPAFWEKARDKFIETGQDIGNTFKNLAGQGMDVAKMAGSAILNMIAPGAGLLMKALPEETPIDKFNKEYALGGDLYQNVVAQSEDPNFEKRLQGYSSDLKAGNIEGQDPFGKNTVSAFGDYPAMATDIYNALTEKAKTKELSQFDKDRLEYYGHVSGLTGKTNIPGTPIMVDDSPFKTFPDDPTEDITILPKDKPIIEKDIIEPVTTIAGNTVFVNTKTGEVFPGETLAYESLDPMGTGAIPPGEIGGPGYVAPPTPENILANTGQAFGYFDDINISQDAPGITEYSTTRPAGIDAVSPEIRDAETIREEAAQRQREEAAERVAAERAAAQAAASAAAAERMAAERRGDGDNQSSSNQAAGKAAEDAQRAAIQEAARAGMTVNQAKASVGMPANLGDIGGGDNNRGGGKIVCTMMNDSYGFGSFRNKIWLRHSKDLAPEYQIGYHKIFLPLVRLSKTNKLLKKTLEHIAVHRTIDIRQETRGKKHLLGRVYRKILEPICYWVGKYAKR
jgi:hypothetical protein